MPFTINTNISSLNAQRILSLINSMSERTLERLTSGRRINKSGDDAAGLQISETLNSQIRGISQSISNAQDGINLIAIAEGSMNVINEHFQRIREITIQAANDTNGTNQRDAIEKEIASRLHEINRVASATEFNEIKLLNGAIPPNLYIQVGPNSTLNDTINIGFMANVLQNVMVSNLLQEPFDPDTDVNFDNNADARDFLQKMDLALDTVGRHLAGFGATQNRLEGAISNLEITRENYEASNSRIRNADIAKESANLIKYQILQQVAVSILTQANQLPSLALSLIRQ